MGQRTEALAVRRENGVSVSAKTNGSDARSRQIQRLMDDLNALISRIDRETPFIQLAITASGETLSTSMPPSISPSRLLQASTLLTVGDTHHSQYPEQAVQIGPAFCLTLYMLFVGHATATGTGPMGSAPQTTQDANHGEASQAAYGLGEGERKPLWQEIIHKARVRLCRAPHRCPKSIPNAEAADHESEFVYYLEIIEDLDDGRVHTDAEEAPSVDGIAKAGIRENISIDQLSKLFYTDSGKLLNISQDTEGGNRPVLLLKRDSSSVTSGSDAIVSSLLEHKAELGRSQAANESDSEDADEQTLLDQQLGVEWPNNDSSPSSQGLSLPEQHRKLFPKHLDPDWIAMEMFEMDVNNGQSSDTGSETDGDGAAERAIRDEPTSDRLSIDSQLEVQIRGLSLQSSESTIAPAKASALARANKLDKSQEASDFVSRSPFGAITTSLSLLEMLIRLASLQEFQQAPHLSIPDHILTFFLEQTSTTGLAGEAGTRIREEVRRKVGFDPYSDNPSEMDG